MMAGCAERALVFDCEGEQLVGVLSVPDATSARASTAVLIIVGGPQYRVGAHRHFVLLARTLACNGFPTLRFDVRGMGDSSGAGRAFDDLTPDIGSAIDALFAAVGSVKKVVLWGLCDGASAALLYLHDRDDSRVKGLCLLNPWVRSEATLARAHVKHYYFQRVMQGNAWRKLLTGGIGLSAITGFAAAIKSSLQRPSGGGIAPPHRESGFQQAMGTAWLRFKGAVLLVLSGSDITAREFSEYALTDPGLRAAMRQPKVRRLDLTDADHTLSDVPAQDALSTALMQWLRSEPDLAED
jgi:exosortase A-associated hydrolase 1